MTTVATLAIKLLLESSGFTDGIKDAEKRVDSFSTRVNKMGDQMMKAGAMMTATMTVPIVAFGTSAVKAAMESEAVIANLESTIQSTGNKTGITSKEFQDMADKLSEMSGYSDEAILNAETMLLTFDQIGKESFPRATEASLDLARRFKMDLGGASIMLGKALNDPAAGLGALSRVGVSFTEQQKQQVKAMMKVNNIAGAQAIIFAAVESQVKGAAEAYGKTAQGEWDRFLNAIDKLKEAIGTTLIPALTDLLIAITPVIKSLAENPIAVDWIVGIMALLALAGPVTTFFGAIMKVVAFFSAGGAGATAMAWVTGTLVPAITAGLTGLAALLGTTILPLLALIAAAALLVYLVWKNWDQLGVTISQLATILKVGFLAGLQLIKDAIMSMVQPFITVIDDIRNGIGWLYEDGSGLLADLAAAFGFPAEAAQNVLAAIWNLRDGAVKLYEDGSGALLDLAMAFGFPKQAAQNVLMVVWNVMNRISGAIANTIAYVRKLASELMNLKLPKALTPGSPTPFEMGLRGIGGAMDTLSKKSIPDMNMGLRAAPVAITSAGGGNRNTYIDNRRFAGGMSKEELDSALNSRMEALLS